MITHDNGIFYIETENTSYIFSVAETGIPEHVYYGRKLRSPSSSLAAMREKHLKAPRMSTLAESAYQEFSLNDTLLEFTTEGKGDYRTPLAALSLGEKGERTFYPVYTSHQITPGISRFRGPKLPQAVASEEESSTLSVTYTDKERKIRLITFYTAFYKADVITRRSVIVNDSPSTLTLRSLLSSSIDLRTRGVTVTTFSGSWGREKGMKTRRMEEGTLVAESRTIQSGETDPTVIIENGKDTYLSSLVYSGAFRTTVTETTNGITHITTGINPDMFSWTLERGEMFESPEAVLAWSPYGREKAGVLMRKFIENHIRRGVWKNRMRPVMLGTWDTLSYDPDETDVLKMASKAKDLGMEGIVIDDGWFGARSDGKSSLGDWFPDTKHFPSGLKDLSNEVHYLGLMFGLWFEMEGISERSMLFHSHPDWMVGKTPSGSAVANNEYLLDISRPDVQDWVIDTLTRIIEQANIDYIRWSLSRYQGDLWSNGSDRDSGEFMHRCLLGLYRILDTVTKTFPNLYLEATSAGGMRFDMGMLSFVSTINVTECTDTTVIMKALEGTGMIYPLSVMSTTIASSPDRYTSRTVDDESAFNVAVFGALNYSINPHELSKTKAFILHQQIEFYKAYRLLFQYGTFRVQEDNDTRTVWTVSNGDSSAVMMLYYLKKMDVNTTAEKLYCECANESYDYSFMARSHMQTGADLVLRPQEIECYNVSGDALKWARITLADNSSGNGLEDGMRTLGDNTSRLYIIRKREETKSTHPRDM